jgi:hypothetical protein
VAENTPCTVREPAPSCTLCGAGGPWLAGELCDRCLAGPVPLSSAVAGLLARSDLIDKTLRLRLAAYREGYQAGHERGYQSGYAACDSELRRSWYAATHPIAVSGVPHEELERRRWGPGGRAGAGDPRPGDYPGRDGAA